MLFICILQPLVEQEEEKKEEEEEKEEKKEEEEKKKEEEEEIDIDLNDPEVEKAAVKIQASFKGFKARKEVSSTQKVREE